MSSSSKLSPIPENFHSILFQAAPLIFVGVGAAVAFRVRFWNLGIEGQMIWGGIAATFVVVLRDRARRSTRLPLMMLSAALAGMAWIMVPLWLRRASAGQRDHRHAAAQLRGAQFPAPPRLRPVARPEGCFPALAAVPRLRASARDRLGHQQRAGAWRWSSPR